MSEELLPWSELSEANRRHDEEPHSVCFDKSARYPGTWRDHSRGPLLTDKRIERYQKKGFYSAEFREARRAYQARKAAQKRVGNFIKAGDGRFIYCPV